jgi:hypothetical protein
MRVRRVPSEASSADRARWLAELSEALMEAQHLIWQIGLVADHPEVMELYGRIEAAFAETQRLRLGRLPVVPEPLNLEWTNPLPWATRDQPRR